MIAYLATTGHKAARTLVTCLTPVVHERLESRTLSENDEHSHNNKPVSDSSQSKNHTNIYEVDCMQWLIETSPRKNPWTVSRMIGEIMALWFGSVHQLSMVRFGVGWLLSCCETDHQASTYAIEDLCVHKDIVELLRNEIEHFRCEKNENGNINIDDLPLLNSFAMESFRTSSSDAGKLIMILVDCYCDIIQLLHSVMSSKSFTKILFPRWHRSQSG